MGVKSKVIYGQRMRYKNSYKIFFLEKNIYFIYFVSGLWSSRHTIVLLTGLFFAIMGGL